MKNLKPENISIVFTSYNILEYLQLAIYSFLEYYPDFKQSIVIFDDGSDDGTKEWIEKEGLKSITWSNPNNFLVQFSNLKKVFSEHTGINASYRNSVMIHNIFKMINTKYIMINDADVLFLKGEWLEKYDYLVTKNKVIAPMENYYYNWNYMNIPMFERFKDRVLGKYYNLYHTKGTKEWMERLHFFHTIIDLDYMKKIDLLFDNIHDKKFIELIYKNATLDTGSDFYWEILNREIPYYIIPDEKVYNRWTTTIKGYIPCLESDLTDCYIYHFRWISSFRRLQNDLNGSEINKHTFTKIKMDFQNNNILYNWTNYVHKKYKTKFPKECLDD